MLDENESRAEPIEFLIQQVGSGKLSPLRALALVRKSESMMYFDLDTGAMSLMAGLRLDDRHVTFGKDSFYLLHRFTYDLTPILGLPSTDVARICLHAAKRINFGPGQYSFHNALGFHLELQGCSDEALLHHVVARAMRNAEAEGAAASGLSASSAVLLQAEVPVYEVEEDESRRQRKQLFVEMVEDGRRSGDPGFECQGWRLLATYCCNMGRPGEAIPAYMEALRIARTSLNPTSVFLLLCDALSASLSARIPETSNSLTGELADVGTSIRFRRDRSATRFWWSALWPCRGG